MADKQKIALAARMEGPLDCDILECNVIETSQSGIVSNSTIESYFKILLSDRRSSFRHHQEHKWLQ